MITMKKTVMVAAVLASMGAAAAQAAPVVNFNYAGDFTMYDGVGAGFGGLVGVDTGVTGTMSMDMGTGMGNAAISSPNTFYGALWTAHNITLQATGPGTVVANMLFDWNGNNNIGVTVGFSMTPTAWVTSPYVDAYQFSITTTSSDMPGGPFAGFKPTFGGTATVTSVDTGAVPVPAAAWLLGSGLLGLVGIGRRKYA